MDAVGDSAVFLKMMYVLVSRGHLARQEFPATSNWQRTLRTDNHQLDCVRLPRLLPTGMGVL